MDTKIGDCFGSPFSYARKFLNLGGGDSLKLIAIRCKKWSIGAIRVGKEGASADRFYRAIVNDARKRQV